MRLLMVAAEVAGQRPARMPFLSNGLVLVYSAALILMLLGSSSRALVECQEQLTVESRQQKDRDDLTDTIKYLENLDKYYSQIARPRFGRSGGGIGPSSPTFSGLNARAVSKLEPLSRRESWMLELLANQLARKYKEPLYN